MGCMVTFSMCLVPDIKVWDGLIPDFEICRSRFLFGRKRTTSILFCVWLEDTKIWDKLPVVPISYLLHSPFLLPYPTHPVSGISSTSSAHSMSLELALICTTSSRPPIMLLSNQQLAHKRQCLTRRSATGLSYMLDPTPVLSFRGLRA